MNHILIIYGVKYVFYLLYRLSFLLKIDRLQLDILI